MQGTETKKEYSQNKQGTTQNKNKSLINTKSKPQIRFEMSELEDIHRKPKVPNQKIKYYIATNTDIGPLLIKQTIIYPLSRNTKRTSQQNYQETKSLHGRRMSSQDL